MIDEDGLIQRKKKRRTIKGGPVKSVKVQKTQKQSHRNLRTHVLHEGLPPVDEMMEEILGYANVLLGRQPSPFENGLLTLMETADAYFARGSELAMLIYEGEQEGTVLKGDEYYQFRTGQLRTFLDMCKRSADLGSRRVTAATLQFEMEKTGKESRGGYLYTEDD